MKNWKLSPCKKNDYDVGIEARGGLMQERVGGVCDDGKYRINKTLHVFLDCNELHIGVKLLTVSRM